jgi:hypothetical protein
VDEKMKLSDFENYFDDVILKRGKDYFSHGHVEKIEKMNKNNYRIEVAGSEYYTVGIVIGDLDEIVDIYCDCPYDCGDYCKHQAAALIALRKDRKKIDTNVQKDNKGRSDIKTIVSDLSKEELIHIILDFCGEYQEIEKKLIFKYTSNNKDVISNSKKLIREHIKKAKKHGFIEWRNVGAALCGAEMTLEKAQKKIKDGEIETAVLLCIAVLSIVVEMLQYSDDSNGVIGAVIVESLVIIDEAVVAGIPILDESQHKKLFHTILKEADNKRYKDWSDWHISLLAICIYFAKNENFRLTLKNNLNRILENITGNSWSSEYEKTNIKLLQLKLIELYDEEEIALQFITDNIQYSPFRERAIANSFANRNYQEVIRLCEEGEKADKQYRGLELQWKKYRLQAYEGLGDIIGQRELLLEFLYHNQYQYYLKLKELYQPNQWGEIQQEILATFEKRPHPPSAYLEILKVEKMNDKLLEYCMNHIAFIQSLYPFLVEDYFEGVNEVFVKFIEMEAELANDRKRYKHVCSIIKTYKKACGENHFYEIIEHLKQQYKRRPAFMDELEKLT